MNNQSIIRSPYRTRVIVKGNNGQSFYCSPESLKVALANSGLNQLIPGQTVYDSFGNYDRLLTACFELKF